jgi:hypothetical protein
MRRNCKGIFAACRIGKKQLRNLEKLTEEACTTNFTHCVNTISKSVKAKKESGQILRLIRFTMKKISIVLAVFVLTVSAQAQDRYFGYTYTTNILPKGAIDLELWHTSRIGHKDQFYHGQDQRMEAEIGLGKNWQTAFYFNRFQERYSTGANGTETESEIGFSNEWKVKLADPDRNKVGFALYGEWGIKGGDEIELETKAIFDKSFGKNLLALNLVNELEKELEWENGETEGDNEDEVELDLGYMYNVNPNFGLGVELRDHNEIKDGDWEHSVLFGGPTVNFRGDRWFVIGTLMPQLRNLHKTDEAPYNKVLDEQERMEARVIVGISF